jgi:hypothetical protein
MEMYDPHALNKKITEAAHEYTKTDEENIEI